MAILFPSPLPLQKDSVNFMKISNSEPGMFLIGLSKSVSLSALRQNLGSVQNFMIYSIGFLPGHFIFIVRYFRLSDNELNSEYALTVCLR